MTYLQFHAVFIFPVILALILWVRGRWGALPRRATPALLSIALIAFVYTTPWDNYLVARGVWMYGGERVIGVIGYVPVEEYLFFLLQPILCGLWFYSVLARHGGNGEGVAGSLHPLRRFTPTEASAVRAGFQAAGVRVAGAAVWLIVGAVGGVALVIGNQGTYAGLILAWAAPVIAGLWFYAGGEIWPRRKACLVGIAVPTLYLWVADAIAIRLGIWAIDPRLSSAIKILGLPVEEALFFLITNVLVVVGLVALLYPPGDAFRIPRPADA